MVVYKMLFLYYPVCCCCCLLAKSCPTLCNPWTAALQSPLSLRFPRQEYWSGLPFPSPEDLLDPRIKPTWRADPLPLSHLGSHLYFVHLQLFSPFFLLPNFQRFLYLNSPFREVPFSFIDHLFLMLFVFYFVDFWPGLCPCILLVSSGFIIL